MAADPLDESYDNYDNDDDDDMSYGPSPYVSTNMASTSIEIDISGNTDKDDGIAVVKPSLFDILICCVCRHE